MHVVHLRSHFWLYSSRVPGLLLLVLVSLSLKTPSQLHAKSNNTIWKTSNSSWNKSNQLPEEKEHWMGNQNTWVQVPVQQIISHMTLVHVLTMLQFACMWNKAWSKLVLLNLYCTWESLGSYFKILTSGLYLDQLDQNLWGRGLGISIYISHMIQMYN